MAVSCSADGAQATADIPASWIIVTVAQLPLLLHILYWLNILQIAGRSGRPSRPDRRRRHADDRGGRVVHSHGLTPFRVLVLIGAGNVVIWASALVIGFRAGIVSFHVDRPALRRGPALRRPGPAGDRLRVPAAAGGPAHGAADPGVRELGVYSLAVTLAELLWLLSDPFASALLPHQVTAERGRRPPARLRDGAARVPVGRHRRRHRVVRLPLRSGSCSDRTSEERSGRSGCSSPASPPSPIQRPLASVLLKRGRAGLVSLFGAGPCC